MQSNPLDSLTVCSEISELAAGSGSQQEGLTKFADEACTEVGVRDARYLMPRGAPVHINTELKEYLARPIVYQRGIYASTNPERLTNGAITTLNMFQYFPHLDRIKGTFGFRATIVIRVEVQATPYHAGRLRLVWEPEYPSSNTSLTYIRDTWLTTMSQLPGVEMNINDTTSVVMRVPFVHSYDYWWYNANLAGGGRPAQFVDIGLWSLWAMHPVSTPTGATNPNYSIWTSLEDVELISASAPDSDLTFITPTVGDRKSVV